MPGLLELLGLVAFLAGFLARFLGSFLHGVVELLPEAVVLLGLARIGLAAGAFGRILACGIGLEAVALAPGEVLGLVVARSFTFAGLVVLFSVLALPAVGFVALVLGIVGLLVVVLHVRLALAL